MRGEASQPSGRKYFLIKHSSTGKEEIERGEHQRKSIYTPSGSLSEALP